MTNLTCPVPATPNAERIVREAWELFQQRGYRGASVNELCSRCGISKPTLYYYFHDKETLFVHVLLRQLHGYREMIEADAALDERLTRLAEAMLTSFDTDITTMMRDMTHIKDPENRRTVYAAFEGELLRPLAAAFSRPDAVPGEGDFHAWAYLGLINTFVGKSERLAASPKTLAQQLVALFLEGAHRTLASAAPRDE